MELTDTHTHTVYSGHGTGTVAEVASAAARLGLTTLALTEHLTLPGNIDPDHRFSMSEPEALAYVAEVKAAQDAQIDPVEGGKSTLEIICGVEIDWRLGASDYINARIAPYELKLGSVHMLADGFLFDHPDHLDEWNERGADNIWRDYIELWCQAVASDVSFDVMSHVDLPKKFGILPSFDAHNLYVQMAAIAAEQAVMVEVNTSGLHVQAGELYPGPDLLAQFAAAGVPCTVGSDAHAPVNVGRDLKRAYAAMYDAGYRQVTVPTSTGDRRQISLL